MRRKLKMMVMVLAAVIAVGVAVSVTALAASSSEPEEGAAQVEMQSEEGTEDSSTGFKALAVCLAIGLAAAGGAIGMGMATGKAEEGISRQPETEGSIRTTMMLGLVFIETAIIYALLVVILVIFVL